jgi:hypothetical protein
MLRFDYELNDEINGEPPPILYLFGTKEDFFNSLTTFIPFLKNDKIEILMSDILIEPVDTKFSNKIEIVCCDKYNAIEINNGMIFIHITKNVLIDIIADMVQLLYADGTVFLDFKWTEIFFDGSVIFESNEMFSEKNCTDGTIK